MDTATSQMHASNLQSARRSERQGEIDSLEKSYALPSSQNEARNLKKEGQSSSTKASKVLPKRLQKMMNNPYLKAIAKGKMGFRAYTLMKYLNPFMDWLFFIALIFAAIKDALDFIDDALIAAAGAGEVLIVITTTICSLIIAAVMFLTSSSEKEKIARKAAKKLKHNKTFLRLLLLIAGTAVEFVPALDLLPVESAVVVIVLWMTLVDREVAAEQKKEEQKLANETADALPA